MIELKTCYLYMMNSRSAFATPHHCSEPITVSTENVLSFLKGTPVRATAYKDSSSHLSTTGPYLTKLDHTCTEHSDRTH